MNAEQLSEVFAARLEEALEALSRVETGRPLLGPPAGLERLPLARWRGGDARRPLGMPWPLEVGEGLALARQAAPGAAERLGEGLSHLAEELLAAPHRSGALARLWTGAGLTEAPLERWGLRGDRRPETAAEAALEAVLEWYEEGRPSRWPDAAEPAAVRDWLSGRYETPKEEELAWFLLSRADLAWLYLAERAERLDAEDREHAERMARERTARLLEEEGRLRAGLREGLEGEPGAAKLGDDRIAALAVELATEARRTVLPILERGAVLEEDGLLSWDREWLAVLEGMKVEALLLEALREEATGRGARALAPLLPGAHPPPAWELFGRFGRPHSRGVPAWVGELAAGLWRSRWGVIEAERGRRARLYGGASVVPLAVARGIARGGLDARRYAGEEEGEQLRLFLPDRQEVARLDLRLYRGIAERLAEAPPAVDALLTYAIGAGFARWRSMPEDGLAEGEIPVRGGKDALREVLGCTPADVEYALAWGQALHLPEADVRGLWLWDGQYQKPTRGRQGVGLLTVQRALLPRAEADYIGTGKGAYFVPWTEAPPLPALRRGRGAVLRLWRHLAVELAAAAAEGRLREGLAVLPEERRRALAASAGLEWRLAEERLAEWVELKALTREGDAWGLGPLYAAEAAVLKGNARVVESAARGGRAAAEAKERGRKGGGRGGGAR